MTSRKGPWLRYQFVDHHPITDPAKLLCNSLSNKEIMEGGGGGALNLPSPKLFKTKKAQSG